MLELTLDRLRANDPPQTEQADGDAEFVYFATGHNDTRKDRLCQVPVCTNLANLYVTQEHRWNGERRSVDLCSDCRKSNTEAVRRLFENS